jgi:hypothetical protein
MMVLTHVCALCMCVCVCAGLFRSLPSFRQDISSSELRARAAAAADAAAAGR